MKLTKTLAITLLTGTMVIGTIGCSSTQPTTINFNSDEPKVEQYKEDNNTDTKDNTPVESTTQQKSQSSEKSQKTTIKSQSKDSKSKSTQSSNTQQKNDQSSNVQPSDEQSKPEVKETPGYNYPRCPICGDYVKTDDAYLDARPAHYVCARNYGEKHHTIHDYSLPLIVPSYAPDNGPAENNNNTAVEPNNTTTEGGAQ